MLGIAMLDGSGFSAYLPRKVIPAADSIYAMVFVPYPVEELHIFDTAYPPWKRNFIWLKDHLVTGDVLVADAGMKCGAAGRMGLFHPHPFPYGFIIRQHIRWLPPGLACDGQ